MKRVVVTDGEQRSSLAVVRSLGRAGFDVVVCASQRRSLAGASRHARSHHVLPPAAVDPAEYRSVLERVVQEAGADVLIPMTDVSATVILPMRSSLSGVLVPFPETSVWETATDKHRLMSLAGSLGVPVPAQTVLRGEPADLDRAREWAREHGYPVVLKPHRSAVEAAGAVLKLEVTVALSEPDLRRRLDGYPPAAYPILLQERIDGPGWGGFFLAKEGDMVARFGHRRIREKPPTGGVSVLREAMPLRSDVSRYSEALLAHFGWSGVAMVEFKEDLASGELRLMEINGRFWGSLQLAIDAGVDFPVLLLRAFSGDVASQPLYREGIRSRWLWGDVDHLLWLLRASPERRGPHPGLPGRLGAVARFLRPGWRRTRLEVLRASDPAPFVRETLDWFAALRK